jgi:uncharacterized tellurite resistance protein B-like protein
MQDREVLDLFRAALALAAADKKLTRAELGVVEGLAAKVGVGQVSFEAMKTAALRGDDLTDNLCFSSPDTACKALELLVAQARIDGQISDEERSFLVLLADKLKIDDQTFQAVYQAGVQRANAIRRRQGK